MRQLAILALAALTSCSTAKHVVEHGPRQEFASAAAPRELAYCAAGKARDFSLLYTASVWELKRPGNYEVVVRKTERQDGVVAVVRTMPSTAGLGSQLVIFTSDDLDSLASADWIERLSEGCAYSVGRVGIEPTTKGL